MDHGDLEPKMRADDPNWPSNSLLNVTIGNLDW